MGAQAHEEGRPWRTSDRSGSRSSSLPFRVEPGRRVRLPHDFDPSGTRAGQGPRGQGHPRPGCPAAGRVPDAARGAGHLRRRRRAPGDGRRRQGRDDPPRHERGRTPRASRSAASRSRRARTSTTTTCGGTPGSCPSAATSGSSTARTTRRSWSSGSIPRSSPTRRSRRSSKGRGIWERRFREINDWERYLTDQGYRIVKLFLNLSKEEQRRRFLSRIDEPEKNWKFSANDAKERTYWDDYQKAFSDVLSKTSTDWAPWYVIPADDKPFARVAAAGCPGQRPHRDRPALPAGQPRGPRGAPGGQGRAARPGARWRRRRIPSRPSWPASASAKKKSKKAQEDGAIECQATPAAARRAEEPRE